MADEQDPIVTEAESATENAGTQTGDEQTVAAEPTAGPAREEKRGRKKKKGDAAAETEPAPDAAQQPVQTDKTEKSRRGDSAMAFFAYWMLLMIGLIAVIGIVLSLINTPLLITIRDVMNNIILLVAAVLFASAGYHWAAKRHLAWKIVFWIILVVVISYFVVNTLSLCGVIEVK